MKPVQIIARMGILIALGVVASYMSAIPAFGAKLFPAQHMLNVIAGATLGPWYAAVTALGIALIRIGLGTGTLLAIPGSIFGACLAGLLFRWTRNNIAGAMVGEVVGTGLLGSLAAYPMATLILGNTKAAAAGITFFIIPFGSSSVAGAVLGGVILVALRRTILPAQQR
ncbi:MAG TPA: energy coupling factor transporter S component ThiW [Symbiobacteriaceae bacterium]|nr:energy coupling factor transporter S component ThiW [Symbiobacteriaceae bacterium]